MPYNNINRREFVALTTAGVAGQILGFGTSSPAQPKGQDWDPSKPPVCTGKALTVQPVLMYRVAEKREATSWKSWGGVQSDEAAGAEAQRISKELSELSSRCEFSVKVLPVIKIKSTS
ncbi:MAG: hypothetical protein MUO33_03115, partial [Sedimentisphaerales bacterium]|nr:hypothetical protein [Sedimentisphaerales bacterium]